MEDQTTPIPIQEPVSDPVIPPVPSKPKNNSVLIILSIFLIALVGVVAFLGYQNFQLQKQITSLQVVSSPTPTIDPGLVPEPVPIEILTACKFNGKTYKNGQAVPSGDKCNTCSCDNGQVACTAMACE